MPTPWSLRCPPIRTFCATWSMCGWKNGWRRAHAHAVHAGSGKARAVCGRGESAAAAAHQCAHPPLCGADAQRRAQRAGHCADSVGLARVLHLGRAPGPGRAQPGAGRARPKAPKPLPKALGVDDAVRLADYENTGADPGWRRDAAMVELLYGCGLRVGELVGLDAAPSTEAQREGRGWVDPAGGRSPRVWQRQQAPQRACGPCGGAGAAGLAGAARAAVWGLRPGSMGPCLWASAASGSRRNRCGCGCASAASWRG